MMSFFFHVATGWGVRALAYFLIVQACLEGTITENIIHSVKIDLVFVDHIITWLNAILFVGS